MAFRLFLNILSSLWLPNVQKINGLIERKMSAIALTKLLVECPKMLNPPYFALWYSSFFFFFILHGRPEVLKANLAVLEGPEDESVPADLATTIDIDDTPGYTPAFSKLSFAVKSDVDPFAEINPKVFLAVGLHNLSKGNPGKVS